MPVSQVRACRLRSDMTRDYWLRVMHRKDDFSDHMTLGEALVRLVSSGEGIAFRDRNFEPRGLHRGVEALEFANSGDAVITDQRHAAPLLRRWLDARGGCDAAAAPKHIQTLLQRVSAGESHYGVDAVGCEAARLIVDVGAFAIDNRMRTHLPHQFHPFLPPPQSQTLARREILRIAPRAFPLLPRLRE